MDNDLISREALLEWVKRQRAEATGVYGNIIAAAINAVLKTNVTNAIRRAPAVDAVKVVRCKDCAEYIPWMNGQRICGRVGSYYGDTDPDDYCSKGRRNKEGVLTKPYAVRRWRMSNEQE